MPEKPRGEEKYTPTCLEWLIVMLNSTFQYQDLRKLSKYRIYGHKKVVFPYF